MDMATFNAYLKKEIMESSRQYRYLVLAIGILLFAILDPLMLKLLPMLVKGQLPVDISALMVITPKSVMINYIKDLYQMGGIFIVFTLGGILSDEVTSQKLVFPYSMGSSPAGIVLAKSVHYALTIVILTFLGFIICYNYSGVLFTGESIEFLEVMHSAILMSIFLMFLMTLTIFLSSLVKKGITAGFISLAISFLMPTVSGLDGVGNFIPYKLIQGADEFSMNNMAVTVIFVLVLCVAFIILTIRRMEKIEVI